MTDEEIFIELKKRYGKESLDVKEYDKEWYDTVENEFKMKTQVHIEEIRKCDFKDICEHEDSDLCRPVYSYVFCIFSTL